MCRDNKVGPDLKSKSDNKVGPDLKSKSKCGPYWTFEYSKLGGNRMYEILVHIQTLVTGCTKFYLVNTLSICDDKYSNPLILWPEGSSS